MDVQQIAVVGAGTMGNGIAHVFAQHGHRVTLIDRDRSALDGGLAAIEKNLGRQQKKEILTADEAEATRARVTPSTSLDEGVAEANLVVEAVTERKEVKASVFAALDAHAPDGAVLASNTSSISITWLGAQTSRPERVIGMHFFNPVPVMKLVEIVRGLETDQEVFSTIFRLAEGVGKTPVAVEDFPGFVSNRVLMPMINEAAFCLMEGVASREAVDTVMQLGMAHPMGPLTLADFIGLDVCVDILEVLHRELGDDKYRACPLLRKMVTAGRLGRKSGRGFYEYE